MNLTRSWAIANDIVVLPVSFARFMGQNFQYGISESPAPIRPEPNPGKLARSFNAAALTLTAVGGACIFGAHGYPMPEAVQGGALAVPAMLAGVAVNFAVWGKVMMIRDKVMAEFFAREPVHTHRLRDYMFPRYSVQNRLEPQ